MPLRNLPSLPGFRQRFLIPMQIQYFYEHTYLCTAVNSIRRKPSVRNCSREREGMYNGNVYRRTLCAQHPVSLRIFPSLPGSRLRFFIAEQIQHPTVHSFLYTPAQIDAPYRLEAHYVRSIKLKKCITV